MPQWLAAVRFKLAKMRPAHPITHHLAEGTKPVLGPVHVAGALREQGKAQERLRLLVEEIQGEQLRWRHPC